MRLKNRMDYKKNIAFQCILLGVLQVISLKVPIVSIVTLLFALVFLVVSSADKCIYYLFFLLPFAPIFKYDMQGFAFFNIVELVTVIKLLYIGRFKLQKKSAYLVFISGVYIFINSLSVGYVDSLRFIISVILGLLIMKSARSGEINLLSVVRYVSSGMIITSFIGLFKDLFPRLNELFSSSAIKIAEGNLYYRFAGVNGNPNHYTFILTIVLACYAGLLIKNKLKTIDYFYVITIVIFGVMTVSKSFLLSLAIIVAMTIYELGKKNVRAYIPTIIVALLVVTIVYCLRNTNAIYTILFRLQQDSNTDSLADITTGRTGIWSTYLRYFGENIGALIFGKGVGVNYFQLIGRAPHNTYIESVLYLGVLGTVLVGSALFACVHVNKDIRTKKLYSWIPYICFFVRLFAINLLIQEQFIFSLVMCSMALIEYDDNR